MSAAGGHAISGKRVVFGFYAIMGLFALAGFISVLIIKSQPIVQVEQRNLARVLSNAYQKYRFDTDDWPTGAYDAAASFAAEKPDFPEKVRKAEQEWGLRAVMLDVEGDSPKLRVSYDKPDRLEQTFLLYKSKKQR